MTSRWQHGASHGVPLHLAVRRRVAESAIKSVQQICGAQGDDAGVEQRNSDRITIEALADLNNGAVVVLGEREVRLPPSGPNVESLEWTIPGLPKYYRVRTLRGYYQVHVKCPNTRYTGWAVQKTEDARTKALARLLYARDYALAGYRDEVGRH